MNKKVLNIVLASILGLVLMTGLWLFVFENIKSKNNSKKFSISREYETCTQEVYEVYKDGKKGYTTSNPCEAKDTYVVYENGEKITVEEALKNKKVTPKELSEKGVSIKSESIVTIWSIKREYDECTEIIYEIHKDKDYQYTTSNPCEALNTYMVYESGEKYTIEEALKSGRVTYDVLKDKGVKIYREALYHTQTNDYTITREYEMCTGSTYKIYKDKEYEYTTSNQCEAKNTYLVYSNGEKITVEDALKNKKVTYDELKNKGVKIYREALYHTQTNDFTFTREYEMCTQNMYTVYEDNKYIYTTSNPCEASIYLVFSNGEKITVEQALKNKKVTYDELKNKGIKIYRNEK